MALDLNRWWKYAQAKVNGVVRSAERDLDQLEAERAAEVAERPWLADDGEAPTMEGAKARIEWEAAEQARIAAEVDDATELPTPPGLPELDAADPDVEAARLELERRERESQARLEAIRKELGVDPPSS